MHAEVGADLGAFSSIWQGSRYGHPELSGTQMLRTSQWALACASILAEPLPVTCVIVTHTAHTLLLPNVPKSAFTESLDNLSIVHLSTVQHPSFIDPKYWTGQAHHARTCKPGIDVIMVDNQKDCRTYCTAITCKGIWTLKTVSLKTQTTAARTRITARTKDAMLAAEPGFKKCHSDPNRAQRLPTNRKGRQIFLHNGPAEWQTS